MARRFGTKTGPVSFGSVLVLVLVFGPLAVFDPLVVFDPLAVFNMRRYVKHALFSTACPYKATDMKYALF